MTGTPLYSQSDSADTATDAMRQFMQELRSYGRLTPEQERDLAIACAAGDENAIKTMVTSNLQLVVSIAREYSGRGVPMLDLIQEGSIGLITAARKFDYTRNLRFSTYATKWIRQGVTRCVMNYNGLIHVPHYTAERMNRVLRAKAELSQQTGEEPDVQSIADRCGMEPEKVSQLLKLCPQTVSLDTPVGDEGEDGLQIFIEDLQTPQPQDELVRQELRRTLDILLSMLTERQREVLHLRYGMTDGTPRSMEQVGKELGISKERVRQIEHQAMEKLKKNGADFGLEDFLA